MKILLGTILALLCSGHALGQKCDVDSGFRGERFSIYYEQRHLVKIFRSLNELPPNVRARLEAYLQGKLGREFAKRLKFDEGQWLDLQRLRREFPALYEQNLRLGAYDLLFRFSDSAKGLNAFYTKLALNDDGSINEEIKLPNIGQNPSKAKIISCKEAYSIAVAQGFPKNHISAEFEYSKDEESFVWIVRDSTGTEPDEPFLPKGKGTYKKIDINANTGVVVRVYKETIFL
ncbi:MAG: hypothetical protein WBN92_19315 [Terriglobia bacterium]